MVGLLANRGQPLVHGKGERIPSLWAVEDDPSNVTLTVEKKVFFHCTSLPRLPFPLFKCKISFFQEKTFPFTAIEHILHAKWGDAMLHEEVVGRIRAILLDGEIPPGARIPERELCDRLQISRTPLREA